MKIAESSLNGWKTLWVKEKLLVTSNFSFSPQCFQKGCFPGASKAVIVWEWVKGKKRFHRVINPPPNKPCFLRDCSLFQKSFENAVEKEKLLFPTVFITLLENLLPFSSNQELSSTNSLSLKESKIYLLGKG